MTDIHQQTAEKSFSQEDLQDLVLQNEQGARQPSSKIVSRLIIITAFSWTLFQLWVASPLSYSFVPWFNSLAISQHFKWNISVLNFDQIRTIHLTFAIFLAYLAYPATRRSPRRYIPIFDWCLAIVAAAAVFYCFIYNNQLALRAGRPIERDVIMAWIGVILLLEATRRALGPPLVIIALAFLCYSYFGNSDLIPDTIRHKGQSASRIASQMWLTSEGVFGVALGVSASFVFLFVLFGSLLDRAGAGNYFIRIAFSLLGHLRGGPAKASVLASGLTGMISGSSIANVVTTGTFTIPLMKKSGFSGEKAAAIEVAAGVDGQIMPPVMGAAAFLMVEYVGMPYTDIIKHAFLPAVLSYIALLYIVHLEAIKTGTPCVPYTPNGLSLQQKMLRWGITLVSLFLLVCIVHFAINTLKNLAGDYALFIFLPVLIGAYAWSVWYGSRYPDIPMDEPVELTHLPDTMETFKSGLHFIIPIAILLWCLIVERFSAGLSAFYAVIALMCILVSLRPLKALLGKRSRSEIFQAAHYSTLELLSGMVAGARNMIAIGVATATAGIIVGIVSLTGIGNVLTDMVEVIAGGSLLAILGLTALICLILGMGLPTTANYIVVASLMAHVVQELGARNGLDVPLIAIHMFVFYFGIMADVTPPVGLASFAAAAIAGSDPIRTGLRAFSYSLRTAFLPFFFIFNTELLMIGVDSFWHALWVCCYSTLAVLLLCTVLQRHFLIRNTLMESLMLLITSFILFIPNVCNDIINKPYKTMDLSTFVDAHFSVKDNEAKLKIYGRGENDIGDTKTFKMYIPTHGKQNVSEILEDYGIVWRTDGHAIAVNSIKFGSAADNAGFNFSYVITKIKLPQAQPNEKIMYIPAMLLLAFVIMSQQARRRKDAALKLIV